jgi:hypothetical protein
VKEGTTESRGDLKQLAATLNKSLKRSPGAYAWAFLFCSLRAVRGGRKEWIKG